MNCKRVLSELFEDDSRRNENSIGASLANELADGSSIRGKRNSSSFVNPLKRTSTICPSYMRIASALLWRVSWGSHEHTRKTEQLFFCESVNAEVNEMSLVYEKNRMQ